MIRIKFLSHLLTICIIFTAIQISAQEKLSLNNWKINNFGKGKSSEVTSNGFILRQNSIVYSDNQNAEASAVIVVCKWLNPVDYVDIGIKLTLYYNNGSYENIVLRIPKGAGSEQKLNFVPKNNTGKTITKIEIQHNATAMEVGVYSIELVTGFKCGEMLKPLNTNLENLINEIKKTKTVDEAIIKKFESVLSEYKNIK